MRKTVLTLTLAALLLTSCAAQENGGNTKQTAGEVTEGAEVMLTLDAEPLLFSSGERYIAEYAVFYTRPEIYNTSDLAFESLAYAKYDKRSGDLVYTEK